MVKKIGGFIAVLAIATVAAWNVNVNSPTKGMSDLRLANVEALAEAEIYGDAWYCIYCNFEQEHDCYVYEDEGYFVFLRAICPYMWSL